MMMHITKLHKYSISDIIFTLLCTAILFTVTSYCTNLHWIQKYSFIFWSLSFSILFLSRACAIYLSPFLIKTLPFLAFFLSYACFMNIFSNINYLNVRVYLILLSYFMYYIGMCSIRTVNDKKFTQLIIIYILTVFIFSIDYLHNYVIDISSWFSQIEYYEGVAKNLIAQTVSTSIICLLYLHPGKYYLKLIKVISLLFLIVIILLLRSRTPLIALLITMIVFYKRLFNSRENYLLLALLIILSLFFYQYSYIIFNHLFNQKQLSYFSFNTLTSSRMYYYKNALIEFFNNPIFGVGLYEEAIDNFFLSTLTYFGIVGFIPVMLIIIFRLYYNYKNYVCKCNTLCLIALVLSLFEFIEMQAEGGPPFGPGVATYFFWFICGYNDANVATNTILTSSSLT